MKCVDVYGARVDKVSVRASFNRAARAYDQVAELQRTVGERLLEHLRPVQLKPKMVADIGAGTGLSLHALERRYRQSQILAVDIADEMLKQARRKGSRFLGRQRFVCGDAEQLPLRDNSVDLLFSNLTLQWCNDAEQAYREFARALAPGGLLLFSTFGPDTLIELRESFAKADGHSHVNTFVDMHDIGDALIQIGFRDVVVDAERITCTYRDVRALMRDLKSLGAHNVTRERGRGLTGKKVMQKMIQEYERYRRDEVLPASYEIIYAYAWWQEPRAATVPFNSGGSSRFNPFQRGTNAHGARSKGSFCNGHRHGRGQDMGDAGAHGVVTRSGPECSRHEAHRQWLLLDSPRVTKR
jgi:malonyl-CoA O-methyltransferase